MHSISMSMPACMTLTPLAWLHLHLTGPDFDDILNGLAEKVGWRNPAADSYYPADGCVV